MSSFEKIDSNGDDQPRDIPVGETGKKEPGLPELPVDYINDQATFNLFRRGVELRAAVDQAMHAGRPNPTEEDIDSARSWASTLFTSPVGDNNLFNSAAFNNRMAELSGAKLEGRQIEINTGLTADGGLEFKNGQEMMAVLAGLVAAGGLMTSSERQKFIDSNGAYESPHKTDLSTVATTLELIHRAQSLEDPAQKAAQTKDLLMIIPSVGGLRDAVRKLAETAPQEFRDVDTVMGPITVLAREAKARGDDQDRIDRAVLAAREAHENPGPVTDEVPVSPTDIPPEPDPVMSATERILADQIGQLERGEGVPTVVSLEKPVLQDPEVNADEEQTEAVVEKTPEEKMRDACQTPATLLEGLRDPEMPGDLKNAVRRLVEAHRESMTAAQVASMWESDVVPKLRNIGNAPRELQTAVEQATGELMNRKATLINAMEASVAHRGGMFDDGNTEAMRRVKIEAEHIRDEVGGGNYKTQLREVADMARRSGVGAMYSEEEITSLGRRLSGNDEPPSMEDLEAIFADQGGQIRNGLEGIRVATNAITAQNEDSSPNWRRRRDNIQELFGLLSRIRNDEAVEGKSSAEVHAINLLDSVIDGANKVHRVMAQEGMYPQRSITIMQQQVVPDAVRGLDVVFAQAEDIKRLARRLQAMVAEIK